MMFMQEAIKQYQTYSKQVTEKLNQYASSEQKVTFIITPVDLKYIEIKFWLENLEFDGYQAECKIKTLEVDYWFNEINFIKMFKFIIMETQSKLTGQDQNILNDLKEKYLHYAIVAE